VEGMGEKRREGERKREGGGIRTPLLRIGLVTGLIIAHHHPHSLSKRLFQPVAYTGKIHGADAI